MKEPEVSVCVLQAESIVICLNGIFSAKGCEVDGRQVIEYRDGNVFWNGYQYQELTFKPIKIDTSFSIENVVIGINFHWQRNETQTFRGYLKLIANDGKICAINILPVEKYLISVISSEMKSTSSLEFLKAHAVISRSWVMAQIKKRNKDANQNYDNSLMPFIVNDTKLIRWYDRQDHTLFDVCADDHCQRYQGITKADNEYVVEAVNATKGQVLKYGDEICDARFSKCCGGMLEKFSSCWQEIDMPYLVTKYDLILDNDKPSNAENIQNIDVTQEKYAKKWINSSPKAFCNTKDKRILSQVLNSYDQETTDFFRWQVTYSQKELRNIIEEKSKMDFGDILDIIPIKRGPSGRICLLEIVGSKKTLTIGKELEIRRILSKTHLYSSAFVIKKIFEDDKREDKVPDQFVLKGAGWGHGVGLCQIGAAVMGAKGYSYSQILTHYYPNALLSYIYD